MCLSVPSREKGRWKDIIAHVPEWAGADLGFHACYLTEASPQSCEVSPLPLILQVSPSRLRELLCLNSLPSKQQLWDFTLETRGSKPHTQARMVLWGPESPGSRSWWEGQMNERAALVKSYGVQPMRGVSLQGTCITTFSS